MGGATIGIVIGVVVLTIITIVSLIIAGVGRLNTDQSSKYFTEISLGMIFFCFKLQLRIIQFPRNSGEKLKHLDCI